MDTIQIVKEYYNNEYEKEWERIDGRPEFLLTCRFLDRYIKPGERVLDIGGGPGRYSVYLAKRGCDVTLLDLSEGNVAFAKEKANENGVSFKTYCGDARFADKILHDELKHGKYDHILLMGPLYHLTEEADRVQAVRAAISLLADGGLLYSSFISVYGGMIYMTAVAPEAVISTIPAEIVFRNTLINRDSFAGEAFTQAYFVQPSEILPFFKQFPLEKLHLFGQEGIMSPNEKLIFSQSKDIVEGFLDFSEKVCENEELFSWAEHLMYIGRKISK